MEKLPSEICPCLVILPISARTERPPLSNPSTNPRNDFWVAPDIFVPESLNNPRAKVGASWMSDHPARPRAIGITINLKNRHETHLKIRSPFPRSRYCRLLAGPAIGHGAAIHPAVKIRWKYHLERPSRNRVPRRYRDRTNPLSGNLCHGFHRRELEVHRLFCQVWRRIAAVVVG